MFTKLKEFFLFIRDILKSRKLIMQFARNDFKVKFAGSYLGITWAFIQPIITILVFWFVFQVGFRTPPMGNAPFILWMICGIIPWFFFQDGVISATNCLTEYHYLVKKVVFRVSILPAVKIVSSLFVHLFFIAFLIIMFLLYGYKPSIYYLQIFYYLAATILLVWGFSWITSALSVFLKDTNQIVGIILQFGFWLTPIMWSYTMLPQKYIVFFELNPMFYIVQGYRDIFINHIWFWQRASYTGYFWLITAFLFIFGALLFRRLRPHFSDVL